MGHALLFSKVPNDKAEIFDYHVPNIHLFNFLNDDLLAEIQNNYHT